jgi:hypothetical protein
LTELIESTARLRLRTGGTWSREMGPRVTSAASGDIIPYNTLKQRFLKWMAEEETPSDQTAKAKARADARGLLKSLEMEQLYKWTEYMRRQYTPATRMALRGQVRELACSVRSFVSVTDICACRLQTSWRHGAFSTSRLTNG